MRVITAAVLAVTMSASALMAAENKAPLAPGKPAGVAKAQEEEIGLWWLLGVTALGGLVVLTQTGDSEVAVSSGTP